LDLRDQLQSTLSGQYAFERELAGGGMSRVFLARETSLNRQVVIKVLPPEMSGEVSAERFKREIALAATLQHPHIVPLLTAGDAGGLPYFIMPFVNGESLRARLSKQGELPISEAIRILREVASALAFAHDAGVVHRDVKPDNVLISGGAAMVTDFGVAKAMSASSTGGAGSITSIGIALGTPAYMAPEQAAADPLMDHRADIYAWGILAYELITGNTPFAGRVPQAILAAHVQEEPESIAKRRQNLPPALSALVMRCLAKRAADRPQQASELVRALDEMVTPSVGLEPTAIGRRRSIGSGALAAGLLVVVVAAVFTSHRIGRGHGDIRSIAVLPFENKSGDTAFDYLAEGMSDELRSQLTRMPGLAVMGRGSSSVFRGQAADARDIGAKLRVASLVQGSVRRVGRRLRVTAELIKADDGTALWSETLERDAVDIGPIRDAMAQAIAGALHMTTAGGPMRPENPEARDYYLRGRFLADKATPADLKQSLVYFNKAVEKDPQFAEAYAAIAWTWSFFADAFMSPAEAYPKTKTAAITAIGIDSLLPEGHLALGIALGFHDWDFAAAEREFRQAIRLRPTYAEAHGTYGTILLGMGRVTEAVAQVDSAVVLDPVSFTIGLQRAYVLYAARRYREVITQAKRNAEILPDGFYFDAYDALAYRELGMTDSALAAFERAKPLANGQPLPGLAVMYAQLGRKKEATDIALALERWERDHYIAPEYVAVAWASVGDMDRAFTWLDKVFEARSSLWLLFSVGPDFDLLRRDPRWATLERRARRQ